MANDARDPHDAGRMGRLDARTVGRSRSSYSDPAEHHTQDGRQRRTRGPAIRDGTVPAIASALMDRVQAVVCLAESRRKADARGDVS